MQFFYIDSKDRKRSKIYTNPSAISTLQYCICVFWGFFGPLTEVHISCLTSVSVGNWCFQRGIAAVVVFLYSTYIKSPKKVTQVKYFVRSKPIRKCIHTDYVTHNCFHLHEFHEIFFCISVFFKLTNLALKTQNWRITMCILTLQGNCIVSWLASSRKPSHSLQVCLPSVQFLVLRNLQQKCLLVSLQPIYH